MAERALVIDVLSTRSIFGSLCD